ncbi:MAG: PAS domain S-box protein [Syntrophorhabdaceae bacterium]|nr:PAS domain S-box protein [Syntrophorhabdaceae bacterium]
MFVERGETFKILAENIPVGLALINIRGEYRYLNPKFGEMFGYDLSDIPDGKAWFEKAYPDPEYRRSVIDVWVKDFELFRPGEKKPWVFRVTCKDSTIRTIHFMPVQLASGEILIAYEDITQLARARQDLEENETKLRLLYEKSVDPIFIFDGKNYIDCNASAVLIMGCTSKEELLKYHPFEISPEYQPDGELSREKGARIIEKAIKDGSSRFEWLHRSVDGREFWVEISLTTIPFGQTRPLMYVVWRDITERKKAEKELRDSEERYRNMFDNIPFPTFVYDFETLKIVDVNTFAVRSYGYSREELLGMTLKDLKPDEDVPSLLAHLSKPDPSQERVPWRHRKRDGTIVDVEITGHALQFPGRNYRIFFANDVTEIRKAGAALKFTQFAVDRAAVGILWISDDGEIIYGNDEICRLLGYTREELKERKIFELDANCGEETWIDNSRGINNRTSESVEAIFRTRGGKLFPVEIAGNYMEYEGEGYICAILQDISGRKITEESLKKREVELKIESSRLQEANTALKVLLKHREDDKKELEEKLIANVKALVLPYIDKMRKGRLDPGQASYVDIVERNLNDILSPFLQKMSMKYSNFTPTEIQVANLIKAGKTSKEIAEIMKVSTGTIDTHRNNIRSKLNLNGKKLNLRAFLISLG